MLRIFTPIVFVFLLLDRTALANVIACSFIQEKEKGGKSNDATCSGDPEVIFSTRAYAHPRADQCEQSNGFYEDYVDFRADLDAQEVHYTSVLGISPFEQEVAARREAQQKNIPLDEARKEYANVRQSAVSFPIMHHFVSAQTDYISPVTDKVVTDMKNAPTRIVDIVQYGMTGEYLLEVPQGGGASVIIDYQLFGRHSAVKMRFGTCN